MAVSQGANNVDIIDFITIIFNITFIFSIMFNIFNWVQKAKSENWYNMSMNIISVASWETHCDCYDEYTT
jgi:uncharacterized membrane protein HdeD (DUF308 family)